MDFLKRLKDRNPVYSEQYRESIIDRFSNVGKTDETSVYKAGKNFHRVYEIYMYALTLGLRLNKRSPIVEGTKTTTFIEIKSWQPDDIVDFLLAGLIARSDIDLNAIEDLDEKEVEDEITKLKKLLEEYANGGFEIIQSLIKEDPYRFEHDDKVFIELLDELDF
jgi:hypothetical protein